ncbi:hypothetical protein GCM10020258_46170 [Sphingomonas yabuuchiae]
MKRGTVYQVIGTAELQAGQPQLEHAELVIYRGEDGKLWARNSGEFHDGRFVPATPASHASDGGRHDLPAQRGDRQRYALSGRLPAYPANTCPGRPCH